MTGDLAAKLAVIHAGEGTRRLPPPAKRATYTPRLPDGRRQWHLADGTFLDPAYDYATGRFTGTLNGRPHAVTPNADLVHHIASQVPGCCVPEQGRALFRYANQAAQSGGACVEIGSALGLSGTWIGWGARTARPDAPLHFIDTFQGPKHGDGFLWSKNVYDEFWDNITYAGLATDTTFVHRMPSRQATADWTGRPVSFLYVDALHTYAAVKRDYEDLRPHMTPGAIVCFDDCIPEFPAVLKYMEHLARSSDLTLLGRDAAMLTWQLPT